MAPIKVQLIQEASNGSSITSYLAFPSSGSQTYLVSAVNQAGRRSGLLTFTPSEGVSESPNDKAILRQSLCISEVPIAYGYAEISPNSIILSATSPEVRIRSWSWQDSLEANGAESPTLTVPQTRGERVTYFLLRPRDVLYIGDITLSVNVIEDVQVESSAVGNEDTAESQYVQSNGQLTCQDARNSIPAGISTPPRLSSHGPTIDETPVKPSRTAENPSTIVSATTKNAIQDRENSHTLGSDTGSPKVLRNMKEESQKSQPNPSLPPSRGAEISLPEVESRKPMDNSLSPLQPLNGPCRSDPSINQTGHVTAFAELGDVAGKVDDETTKAESQHEESPILDSKPAENSLQATKSKRRPSSPLEERTSIAAFQSAEVAVEEEHQESTTPHYLRKGAKRTKLAAPNNGDSQDSMQGAVTLQRRPAAHESPQPSAKQPEISSKSKTPLRNGATGKEASVARTSKEPASSLETTKSSLHEESAQPTSSFRSTRSAARESLDSSQSLTGAMKVVFASSVSVDKSKVIMKFLLAHGIRQVKNVAEADILCVGKNTELKRTHNLISAVASGKRVITDSWVIDSAKQDELLDLKDYEAKDPRREAEWGTTLSDAVERGRQGAKVLSDWTVCFTSNAKTKLGKGFSELKEICLQAGATTVQSSTPKSRPQKPISTLVIAVEDDKELDTLHANGWQPYVKDIITYSILRGDLDVDSDEFSIRNKKSTPPSTGGKKRKQ